VGVREAVDRARAAEDVEGMRQKGLPSLKAGDFAENLLVSGIRTSELGLGSRLKLGDGVELVITQVGKVCHHHCAIFAQTGDCIMPRNGLFARVMKGGAVREGDLVQVLETVSRTVFQCVVLTASDRCSRGETEDTAGPAVASLLRRCLPAHLYACEILPDDRARLADR
ncbi:MAG: MOSC domain-containing protein, partial [bacterium]